MKKLSKFEGSDPTHSRGSDPSHTYPEGSDPTALLSYPLLRHLVAALAASLIMLLPSSLSAADVDLLFPGELEYDNLRFSAILAGKVPVTNTFPLFERKAASGPDLKLTFATPTLWYRTPADGIDDLALSTKSTESPAGAPLLPEIHHFIGSLPDPIGMSFEFGAGEHLGLRTELQLAYRVDNFYGTDSSFTWNQAKWFGGLLGNMASPKKSWIALDFPGWQAAAGRFPSGMASGHFGGVLMNPTAPWYDQLRLGIGEDKVRVTWMLSTSSAQLSEPEAEVQFRRDRTGSSYWDVLGDHDMSGADEAFRLATWHQFEYRPFEWLSLGIAESGLVGGRTPGLAYLLPTGLWHNTYSAGYSNVAAALNFALVPLKSVMLSGELLVDDAITSDEPSGARPAAWAWRSQLEWVGSPRPDAWLSAGLEYGHADTWTYVRWQPCLSWYQRQILPGGHRAVDVPLGSPYGPDSDYLGLWFHYESGKTPFRRLSLDLGYEFVLKGPIRMGMITQQSFDVDGDSDLDQVWVPVYYDYDRYAGTGALAAILASPDEIRHIITAAAQVPLFGNISGIVKASFGYYDNYENVKGAENSHFLLYAGLCCILD